jgi:hypothetical protein
MKETYKLHDYIWKESLRFTKCAEFSMEFISYFRNSVVNFMLDGTSIKQAVEMGRSGGNCGATYSRCPFTKESLFAAVRGLMADEK